MVRAIKTENAGHLTNEYENASTGMFASAVTINATVDASTIYIRRLATEDSDVVDSAAVWIDATPFDPLTLALDLRTTTSITINGNVDPNTLTIDHGFGSPVPSGGIDFNAGGDSDTLRILGDPNVADSVSFDSGTVTLGGETTYTSLEAISFDGKLGYDHVSIVDTNLAVQIPASQEFHTLTIASGASAIMEQVGENVILVSNTLNLNAGSSPKGTLNLNDNDMIVRGGSYSTLASLIVSGSNGVSWDGEGLTSTAAGAATPKVTTLGLLVGSEYNAIYSPDEFHGYTINAGDALVKYTYYGDTDFNGVVDFDDYSRSDAGFNNNRSGWLNGDIDYNSVVDFDDYSRIDAGFNNNRSGWLNGDVDGNGIVDFDDYSLIDQAFNTQGSALRPALPPLGAKPAKGGSRAR